MQVQRSVLYFFMVLSSACIVRHFLLLPKGICDENTIGSENESKESDYRVFFSRLVSTCRYSPSSYFGLVVNNRNVIEKLHLTVPGSHAPREQFQSIKITGTALVVCRLAVLFFALDR
jgi:hypothetical protein